MKYNSKRFTMPKTLPSTRRSCWSIMAIMVCAVGSLPSKAWATTDIAPILAVATSMPAEFHADALLQTIVRQRTEQGLQWPLNRADVIARIEKIYSLGFNASTKLPLRPVASAPTELTSDWMGSPLDRLSLQMAAALEMVPIDSVRAQAMFERDEKLRPAIAGCAAVQFEDYAKVYDVARAVLARQSTPNPKYVEERLDRAKGPTALAPILEMASATEFSAADYGNIVRWTVDAFKRMRGNEQAFSASLLDVDTAFAGLRFRLEEMSVDAASLNKAYAAYLTENISAKSCQENLKGMPLQQQNAVVESNRELLSLSIPSVQSEEETTQAEHPAAFLGIMATEAVTAITGEDDGAGALSGSALKAAQVRLLDAVDGTANFAEDELSSVFRARSNALLDYLDVAPPGAERHRAERAVLSLVSNSPLYANQRVHWFQQAKRLLQSMPKWPNGPQELQNLGASANPVLRTYALLAKEGMIDLFEPLREQ